MFSGLMAADVTPDSCPPFRRWAGEHAQRDALHGKCETRRAPWELLPRVCVMPLPELCLEAQPEVQSEAQPEVQSEAQPGARSEAQPVSRVSAPNTCASGREVLVKDEAPVLHELERAHGPGTHESPRKLPKPTAQLEPIAVQEASPKKDPALVPALATRSEQPGGTCMLCGRHADARAEAVEQLRVASSVHMLLQRFEGAFRAIEASLEASEAARGMQCARIAALEERLAASQPRSGPDGMLGCLSAPCRPDASPAGAGACALPQPDLYVSGSDAASRLAGTSGYAASQIARSEEDPQAAHAEDAPQTGQATSAAVRPACVPTGFSGTAMQLAAVPVSKSPLGKPSPAPSSQRLAVAASLGTPALAYEQVMERTVGQWSWLGFGWAKVPGDVKAHKVQIN
eukprot:334998-Chlamydomonas_euryale.AAC.5